MYRTPYHPCFHGQVNGQPVRVHASRATTADLTVPHTRFGGTNMQVLHPVHHLKVVHEDASIVVVAGHPGQSPGYLPATTTRKRVAVPSCFTRP